MAAAKVGPHQSRWGRLRLFVSSSSLALLALALPPARAFLPPTAPQWRWGGDHSSGLQQQLQQRLSREERARGVVTGLIINPKRKGITTVSLDDIKAKKASLTAPPDLHGRILVTGSLDEEVCSLLNEQRVWTRITVMSEDPSAARKRLTSRTTRYSGVLDLLHFEEGNPHDLAELEKALEHGQYNAWLDVNNDPEPKRLLAKAKLVAQQPSLKYFVSTVSLTPDQISKQELSLEPVAKALRAADVKFRLLVTGPVIDAPATGFVRLNDTTFLQPNATITRGDISRIATEFFLVSEKQEATCIYASEGDEAVMGYLRFCREQGMNYKAEIEDQLLGGLYTYKDRVAAAMAKAQAEIEGALGGGKLGGKTDSEVYAEYRQNMTRASIASGFEKKRRVLVGMVKRIVSDILEEEYDDMYYSMRTKQDLELYKRANWQRAVNLVLDMLMAPTAGERSKESQKLTGFQDPYLGPQWHVIKSNAAVAIKIKELFDEIGDRVTKEDWEKFDMLQGDFLGDEEAVLAMQIEEKTRRNRNYLRETLTAPPRKKAPLVVERDQIDKYRQAAQQLGDGEQQASPAALPEPKGEELAPQAAPEEEPVVAVPAGKARKGGKASSSRDD